MSTINKYSLVTYTQAHKIHIKEVYTYTVTYSNIDNKELSKPIVHIFQC